MAIRIEQRNDHHDGNSPVLKEGTCPRCGGLLVTERCFDLRGDMGKLDFSAQRCLLCGDLFDALILRNRRDPINLDNQSRPRHGYLISQVLNGQDRHPDRNDQLGKIKKILAKKEG